MNRERWRTVALVLLIAAAVGIGACSVSWHYKHYRWHQERGW